MIRTKGGVLIVKWEYGYEALSDFMLLLSEAFKKSVGLITYEVNSKILIINNYDKACAKVREGEYIVFDGNRIFGIGQDQFQTWSKK